MVGTAMIANFPFPVIGVGAVVWKDDKVLLVKRGNPPRKGSWTLPGGKQQIGETIHQAVIREIREETGIEMTVIDVAAVVDLMDRDEQDRVVYHYTVIDVVAEWLSGEAVAGDDAAAVRWAGQDDFSALGLTEDAVRVIAVAAEKRYPDQTKLRSIALK